MSSKITIDTNLLVRLLIEDNERQMALARSALNRADHIAVTTAALCELNWVLRHGYKIPSAQVATAIRGFLDTTNVEADRPAVEAGLDMLDAGGDFADGVVAFEGAALGGDVFLSFDKRAVKLLNARGVRAIRL